MRPRKAIETNRKHFTRAERDERLRAEQSHHVGRAALENFDVLEGLTDGARAEYQRIVESAWWLDDLDRNDAVNYAICYDRARRIAASADAAREVLALTNGDGSRKFIRNPMWIAWRECNAEMRAISLKLGLSTIDRLKLAAPTDEPPPNKWLKFLKD